MQPSCAPFEYKKGSFPFDIDLNLLCLVVTPTAPSPISHPFHQASEYSKDGPLPYLNG